MTSVVYYLRRNGDIKIGTTTRFSERMQSLRPEAVLAVEPGGRKLEGIRHREFAALRLLDHPDGVEWFRPSPELLAHIARVAEQHGFRPPTLTHSCTEAEMLEVAMQHARGEVTIDSLDPHRLLTLGAAALRGRQRLHEVTLKLRQRGWTFAQIGERFGVTESAASRWVEPPNPPGRRPRGDAGE